MADLGDGGRHPVVIVSREELNRGDYVVGVGCTSARFEVRRKLRNCVPFSAGSFGFEVDCVAQCENILSLHKAWLDLDGGPRGVLDAASLRDVIKAIGYSIESECEPE